MVDEGRDEAISARYGQLLDGLTDDDRARVEHAMAVLDRVQEVTGAAVIFSL